MRPVFDGSYTVAVDLDDDDNPVLDENGVPTYVAAYERDPNIWKIQGSNPWHKNLDNVMFYL